MTEKTRKPSRSTAAPASAAAAAGPTCIMAIVSKPIFEKQAGRAQPGQVVPLDRYLSANKALAPLGAGGKLFLFTVRPEGEKLWLVAVLENLSQQDGAWVAAQPNRVAITDISDLKAKIKFESGKGIAAKAGALAMSLQTPRALSPDDVTLILAAAGAAPGVAPPPKTEAPAPGGSALDGDGQLLAAVLAAPEDDQPRLVYADYLQQRGDPRGELITIQCMLAAGPEYPRQRREYRQRERELLELHRDTWSRPVKGLGKQWVFRRGFIDEVSGPAGKLVGAAALLDLEPVMRLDLTAMAAQHASTLAAAPWLARMRRLRVRGAIKDAGASALAMSPYLGSLTHLNLGDCRFGSSGAARLAQASIRSVRSLSLTGNRINDGGLTRLLATPLLASCQRLYLSRCGLTDEAAIQIAESARLANLVRLCLGNNAIGDAGGQALARAPHLDRLRRLELDLNELSPATRKLLEQRFGKALRLRYGNPDGGGGDGDDYDYDE